VIRGPGFLAVASDERAGLRVLIQQPGLAAGALAEITAGRSRGVGRAVMLGSLAQLADLPVTLTASRLGRALYESLGFTAAADSTWWASR
jgi:hypothetical protein